MSDQPTFPQISQTSLDELAERGRTIYETQLREKLEPAHVNEYVVIHVDTGEYALGRTLAAAQREMRRRYARDGRLVGLRIGSIPEYGLAARLLAAGMRAPAAK